MTANPAANEAGSAANEADNAANEADNAANAAGSAEAGHADEGPQIPPPPWQRLPDRQARRRKEPISRDAIVTAAIRLLDREGLTAISMRRLGEELGVEAMSLYNHVQNKAALLDGLFERVLNELPEPIRAGECGGRGSSPPAPPEA